MKLLRRLGSTYARIWRTFRAWAPSILLLAAIVFIPLGLIDALTVELDLETIDIENGIKVVAVLATAAVLTTTGLLGEIFFSGAIAVSLTHPEHDRPPPLTHLARELNYRRLIAVDLLYILFVWAGFIIIVPGVLIFVFFGLCGPVVELEQRTVRGAFARSFQLVRGNFWFVFWILAPIQVIGQGLGEAIVDGVHNLLGDTFLASWLAETASNMVLSPFFAVAAVLLTVELIHRKDGAGPQLHVAPGVVA